MTASATCPQRGNDVWVHVSICRSIHPFFYLRVCACMCVGTHTHAHTHTHTHTHAHTHTHTHIICMVFSCLCMYVCMYVCVYACIFSGHEHRYLRTAPVYMDLNMASTRGWGPTYAMVGTGGAQLQFRARDEVHNHFYCVGGQVRVYICSYTYVCTHTHTHTHTHINIRILCLYVYVPTYIHMTTYVYIHVYMYIIRCIYMYIV